MSGRRPPRRWRWTWDHVGSLDADHLAAQGVLDSFRGEIELDASIGPACMEVVHHPNTDVLRCSLYWDRSIVDLVRIRRKPCRFGGARPIFLCPACGSERRRLAVVPESLRCGPCGSVTHESKRESPLRRAVRRANRAAARLGLEAWILDANQRPRFMHERTYARLTTDLEHEREALQARFTGAIGSVGARASLQSERSRAARLTARASFRAALAGLRD